ncbi:MAG: DUF167 domain-containing protein [Patescibacteria group bacterium]
MNAPTEPVLIRIRVTPDSKKEGVYEGKRRTLEVSVKESAEGNRANARAIALVARHLGLPEKAVHIIRGHHLRVKMLQVYGYANKS